MAENDKLETKEEEIVKVETKNYTDEDTGFSIEVPLAWEKVIKDGYATFVHSPSATSLQIQKMKYDPTINNVDVNSLSSQLSKNGASLTNFYWIDNSSYATMHSKRTNNTNHNYIEITTFDREIIIKVVYIISNENYSKLEKEISYSIDSISWNKQKPIPDGVYLAYSDFGNFEYAVPLNWTSGFVDGAFYAQDENSGATMTVTADESNATYQNVSQLDYVNFVAPGRSNFVLSSYNADDKIIYATATYMSGDTQMTMIQYMLASGTHEYSITFECPTKNFQSMFKIFEDSINVFRKF